MSYSAYTQGLSVIPNTAAKRLRMQTQMILLKTHTQMNSDCYLVVLLPHNELTIAFFWF